MTIIRLSTAALLGLSACAPAAAPGRSAPTPIVASASELPPEVADAVLCFQAGNFFERVTHQLKIPLSPTDRGILWRGYDAAHDVIDDYYGPEWGPVEESDARTVMDEFMRGFVDPATAPDPIRASAANYVRGNMVLAACQRVR
jgi:hypothetical protein